MKNGNGNARQKAPTPRRGMPSPRLEEEEFKLRYRQQFFDPAFSSLSGEIERIAAVAWDAYVNSRKAPVTRKAGDEFRNPSYDLSVEWLAARDAIRAAQGRFEDLLERRLS